MTARHRVEARDALVWHEGEFWLMTPAWTSAWDVNPSPSPESFDPIGGSTERALAAERIAREIASYRLHDPLVAWRGIMSASWELLDHETLAGSVLLDRAPTIATLDRGRITTALPADAIVVEMRLPVGMPVLPIGAIGAPIADPSDLLLPADTRFTIVRAHRRTLVTEAVRPD